VGHTLESREERRARRAREEAERAAALAGHRQRQATVDAVRAELVRRGIGDHQVLALASREQLIRLIDLEHAAVLANGNAYRDELDRRTAADLGAEEERQRTESFKSMFEQTMAALERLGAHELPELAQFREEYQKAVKRAEIARKAKPTAASRVMPMPIQTWIEQRARQFDDDGNRYGARRIWKELGESIAKDEWIGVTDAPTLAQVTDVVKRVRGKAPLSPGA
jgi:hypothetical protein